MGKKLVIISGILAVVLLSLAACSGNPGLGTSYMLPTVTAEAVATAAEQPTDQNAAPAGASDTYVIVSAESEARFIVNEVLNGADFTVVGKTSMVEGSITIDMADLTAVSMSPVRVDLSDLKTDNSFRNASIHSFILETGKEEFRYAVFEAKSFTGLPASVEAGVPFTFQITGDLTIHGVTRKVTFDATVTPVSETRLVGTASLTVVYSDFNIGILRLPAQVASVEDNVILEIAFVAEKG